MFFIEKGKRTIKRLVKNVTDIPFVRKSIAAAKKNVYAIRKISSKCLKPKTINYAEIRNKQEYFEYLNKEHKSINELAEKLDKKARRNKAGKGYIMGYCVACDTITRLKYYVTPHEDPKNPKILFGNVLECKICKMSSRLRYMIHMMKKFVTGRTDLKIYAYEQVTSFYSLLQKTFGTDSTIIGSEYLKTRFGEWNLCEWNQA